MPPVRKRPGPTLAGAIGHKKLIVEYYVFAALARLFGGPFWFSEQKRTRLLDRIDNEDHDQ